MTQQPRRSDISLRNRLRYRFDTLLARGTWAVLLWLGILTLGAVLFSSLLLTIFGVTFSGSADGSWLEDFWQSLLRVIDGGTMVGDVGWGRRILALLITIVGLLVAGTLIGVIANGIEQRVDQMRRGRSRVVESGHVVILGASARLPVVVQQLALANRVRHRDAIVLLAEDDPAELEEYVRSVADDLYGSRLVIRSGDPARTADLALAGVDEARAIIVLADEDTRGDAGVVKAVLAAGAELGGFDGTPIVAEVSSLETGVSLVNACGSSVHPVIAMQAVGRVTGYALREPGLSPVVGELLDLHGSDIHVLEPGEFAGLSFGDAVIRLENARPIGRIRAGGGVEINPNAETDLGSTDRLIVIADDRRTPELAAETRTVATRPVTHTVSWDTAPRQEHVLMIGWNNLAIQLLAYLHEFGAPGSSAQVVYDSRLFEPHELEVATPGGLEVAFTPNDGATWRLEADTSTSHITSIVLLGYRRAMTPDEADSRTLLNLMLLRKELEARGGQSPRVVVELLDAENVELARITGADDYVFSDAIASRLMVQFAEQPERRSVLLSLYASEGASIHLVSAVHLGVVGGLRFAEIVSVAYASGLLAVGWRRSAASDGEVVLNPRLSDQVQLDAGDEVVVIG